MNSIADKTMYSPFFSFKIELDRIKEKKIQNPKVSPTHWRGGSLRAVVECAGKKATWRKSWLNSQSSSTTSLWIAPQIIKIIGWPRQLWMKNKYERCSAIIDPQADPLCICRSYVDANVSISSPRQHLRILGSSTATCFHEISPERKNLAKVVTCSCPRLWIKIKYESYYVLNI